MSHAMNPNVVHNGKASHKSNGTLIEPDGHIGKPLRINAVRLMEMAGNRAQRGALFKRMLYDSSVVEDVAKCLMNKKGTVRRCAAEILSDAAQKHRVKISPAFPNLGRCIIDSDIQTREISLDALTHAGNNGENTSKIIGLVDASIEYYNRHGKTAKAASHAVAMYKSAVGTHM
jgi:hypothetical protein